MVYLAAYFVAATLVLWHSYRHATHGHPAPADEVGHARHHARGGTVHSLLRHPVSARRVPTLAMRVSVLSLVFLPLTFGYAIFRYRLMDVDLIFKRGMAYTIAAGAITAGVFRSGRRGVRSSSTRTSQRRPDRVW